MMGSAGHKTFDVPWSGSVLGPIPCQKLHFLYSVIEGMFLLQKT